MQMRKCPKCGYHDPPYWRPAKMHNPSGDMDIARIDDLQLFEKDIAAKLLENRAEVVHDGHFAYLLGKRAVWVKRIAFDVYRDCGIAAFKPPFETSRHNPLTKRVSGRTRTTWRRKSADKGD